MRASVVNYFELILLSLLWGLGFVSIKYILTDIQPVQLATLRLLISASALYIYLKIIGEKLPTDKPTWKIIFIASIFGMTLPFLMVSWGMQSMTSSLGALIMSTTPIATLIISHFLLHNNHLTLKQMSGMALGVLGVFILMGGLEIFKVTTSNISKLALFTAAFFYAYSAVRLRELKHLSPAVSATSISLVSMVIIAIISVIAAPVWHVQFTPTSFWNLIYLALISTALGTILMARLIFSAGPAFMSFTNFLVPVFAVLGGMFFHGDPLSKDFILATALIFTGIALARPQYKTPIAVLPEP